MPKLHSARPALKSREGQEVVIVRATTASDLDHDPAHTQSLVRFPDGTQMTVRDDEIQGAKPAVPPSAGSTISQPYVAPHTPPSAPNPAPFAPPRDPNTP